MKNGIYIFLILMRFSCPAQDRSRIECSLKPQYQLTSLHWSISGNLQGKNPNILSELQWKKIQSTALGADLSVKIVHAFFLEGDIGFGRTISGEVRDRDFEGNNRTDVLFDAHVHSNKGNTFHYGAGTGFICLDRKKYQMKLAIGYKKNTRSFYLNDDSFLNSVYRLNTSSLYAGFSQEVTIGTHAALCWRIDYTQLFYDAAADWNLIDAFQHPRSFTHQAKGFGLQNNMLLFLSLNDNISVILSITQSFFSTGTGIDTLYRADGTIAKTRLNDVTGTAFLFGTGIGYRL